MSGTHATATQADPGDRRWAAVMARSRDADFLYAVKTTRIFCRPSCPSRRPKPDNVMFFDSVSEAQRAGFRPCLRCQPAHAEPRAHLVTDLCRFLEANLHRPVSLTDLADFAGLTPWHVTRVFKAELGISPREYREAKRREQMPEGRRRGDLIRYTLADSPLGTMLVAESAAGICAVSFGGAAELVQWLHAQFPASKIERVSLPAAVTALLDVINGAPLDLPLDVRATAFQQRVWKALRDIPRGRTYTYAELAASIGQPTAVRAVARACASNRIAVAIPCHRIVRTDGDLGGYRWGVERKRKLLEIEK